MKMTKSELIQEVSKLSGESLKTTDSIINQTLDTIQSKLAVGETVEILGFGKFFVVNVNERKGRNPRTGEDIIIPAHKSAHFRVGKMLKNAVNSEGAG